MLFISRRIIEKLILFTILLEYLILFTNFVIFISRRRSKTLFAFSVLFIARRVVENLILFAICVLFISTRMIEKLH